MDKDFGELVYRQKLVMTGVLLLRLSGQPPERKAELVAQAFKEREAELIGAFTVLTARAIRIRRPSQSARE